MKEKKVEVRSKSVTSKNKISKRYQELLRKREEALNDPNNPLSKLRSNYYRNNFTVEGDEDVPA